MTVSDFGFFPGIIFWKWAFTLKCGRGTLFLSREGGAMRDISFDGAPHQFFKLLEELIEIIVCGIFLLTISFLYDPKTLQDN